MNLLFLDLETTGLSPKFHSILEIAATVVDGETLKEGPTFHSVVWQNPGAIAAMDAGCSRTHTESGLVKAVEASTTTLTQADEHLSLFIKTCFFDYKPMLAGNSVHFDLSFVNEHMPRTAALLSYRIVDVSGMYRTLRMLGVNAVLAGDGIMSHRAQSDVRHSIDQLHLIKAAVTKGKP
jgi:oligoribonuclease